MERTAARIADHVKAHGIAEICLVLHGGEPLLTGPGRLRELIAALRGPLGGVCETDLRIHTNGVLLDRRFCELFREQGVKVGISLDGDRAANDRHRLFRNGRSSYDKVRNAVELLRADYPELFSGLLCTIDVANDPIAVYDALVAHRPPAIDFLWPHHTWDRPPPRSSGRAYAAWLITIFDKWHADGRPVPVRMFDSVIRTSRGGSSLTESLGLEAADVLVVETDGGYEQADSMKTAFHGAPQTGMDVFANSIDEVGEHPYIRARQGGLAALCATCRACPVVAACGGGLFAHRYRGDGSGFANPSVYCEDLLTLIDHIQLRTARLPAATIRSLATGYGDAAAITRLRHAEAIGTRSLIAAAGAAAAPSAARDVLTQAMTAAPDAVDSALAHPYVRVRAVSALRRGAGDDLLATVACVAAARAGIRATLTVPVRDGAVYLPALGRYTVPGRDSTTVAVDGGDVDVAHAERIEHVRHLIAPGLTVALDDLDPYRDCHDWPAAPRLDGERFEAWQVRFAEAWTLLAKEYGEYAPAIRDALSTIVPLEAPAPGRDTDGVAMVSSAARDAFGSVGIALPGDPAMLCLLILHEFQHVKLGAILDFADLYDPADDRRYHAPWRADPRPLEGLLQGTYAHIAVADFWRRRAQRPRPDAAAARHFADWYPKTLAAAGALRDSGGLTGLGQQFVAGMQATLESWRDPA